jgi:L-asparaginase/Glu-tRNA(Gln) amidotransferase subunit D
MRGVRTTKHSSMSMNAFDSPNFPPTLTLSNKFNIRKDLILYP